MPKIKKNTSALKGEFLIFGLPSGFGVTRKIKMSKI